MNKLEILGITALLFLIGSVWAAHSWRKKPTAVEPDPGPIRPRYDYNDPDPPTMPMEKLMPYAEQLRHEGYAEGEAAMLRRLQDATRPPPYQHRSPPEAIERRRRRQPHHDMTQPGAPSQRIGDRRVVHPEQD